MSARVRPCWSIRCRIRSATLGGRRGHFALLVGGDQPRLRLQAREIGRLVGVPQALDASARTRQLRVAVDQDQRCVHHTVSASILSVSRRGSRRT